MRHRTRQAHGVTIGSIALLIGMQAMLLQPVAAQVVLDMPAPPAKQTVPPLMVAEPSQPAQAQPVSGESTYEMAMAMTRTPAPQAAQQQNVSVGDVALFRYSYARNGRRDTYYDEGMYRAGIRTYSYPRFFPQFVWGPWFFPFHFHHCW